MPRCAKIKSGKKNLASRENLRVRIRKLRVMGREMDRLGSRVKEDLGNTDLR